MKNFMIHIELSGDKEGVFYNLNNIVDAVDPTFLDTCVITFENKSEEIEDA